MHRGLVWVGSHSSLAVLSDVVEGARILHSGGRADTMQQLPLPPPPSHMPTINTTGTEDSMFFDKTPPALREEWDALGSEWGRELAWPWEEEKKKINEYQWYSSAINQGKKNSIKLR